VLDAGDVDAAADGDAEGAGGEAVGDLAGQAALADAGVAGDEEDAGVAARSSTTSSSASRPSRRGGSRRAAGTRPFCPPPGSGLSGE
jgi:hypothetical protein